MSTHKKKETIGAWVIHHGRKVALDSNGAAEFPAIDEASKAATLLTKLGESGESTIPKTEVRAIAVASGLNPRHELNGLLSVLQKKRLVDQSENEVTVLGVTTRGSLQHASDLFSEADPNTYEKASIDLAEMASSAPVRRSELSEKIGDFHALSSGQVSEFLDRAELIGFVDREGDGPDRLLFNGNLFRRDSVAKTQRVLESLAEQDQRLLREIQERLGVVGCMNISAVEGVLSKPLFEKLLAAGLFDLNQVTNDQGSHVFVTADLSPKFHPVESRVCA